ncbi:MAG: crotonase/enoyl-CoA hydratase family protein, partial [Desulfobulbia bacterium]
DNTFCSGADLKSIATSDGAPTLNLEGHAPLGVSRMQLSKPVIAAVEGYAVAGGLELALWCDLRVAASDAIFGVYCRRFGVPLVDGGTVRLPRLIGQGHAMDMILTGRAVSGKEALSMGLVNRLTSKGKSLETALALAESLCHFPQTCMRSDRLSTLEQWAMSEQQALINESSRGLQVLQSGETLSGAKRFNEKNF